MLKTLYLLRAPSDSLNDFRCLRFPRTQVMGAALSYCELTGEEAALKAAAVTKLSRNLLLAAVVPGLTALWWRQGGHGST